MANFMTVQKTLNPAAFPSPNFARLGIVGLYAWSVLLILAVVYFPKLDTGRVWLTTSPKLEDIPHALNQLDGKFYERILLYGYANAKGYPTLAAFFPGYPVVARLFWECGLPSKWSLLVTNWLALGGAFYLLHRYMMRRFPASESMALLVVAALALKSDGVFHAVLLSRRSDIFVHAIISVCVDAGPRITLDCGSCLRGGSLASGLLELSPSLLSCTTPGHFPRRNVTMATAPGGNTSLCMGA
ncbi:MAG: hypothetical protein U0894_01150 [Pirellulales bacterium]